MRGSQCSLNNFGQDNVNAENLRTLPVREIGQMLHDSAMSMAKSSWETEAQECSKLDVLQRLLLRM